MENSENEEGHMEYALTAIIVNEDEDGWSSSSFSSSSEEEEEEEEEETNVGANENGGNKDTTTTTTEFDVCPICFQPWTSVGNHQICCLPCGHIYGLSCINKWLNRQRDSGKCPQCNSECRMKDVRVLYVTRVSVADDELHKRLQSLEAKCAKLEPKGLMINQQEVHAEAQPAIPTPTSPSASTAGYAGTTDRKWSILTSLHARQIVLEEKVDWIVEALHTLLQNRGISCPTPPARYQQTMMAQSAPPDDTIVEPTAGPISPAPEPVQPSIQTEAVVSHPGQVVELQTAATPTTTGALMDEHTRPETELP